MSTCVFCGQPVGANGSVRLYHLEDTGAEGHACPLCEARLQSRGFGFGEPSFGAPPPGPSAPVDRYPQAATHPPAALPPKERPEGATPGAERQPRDPSASNPQPHRWDPPQDSLDRLLGSSLPKLDKSPHSPWILSMKILAWLLFGATVVGVCLWGSQATFLAQYFQNTLIFLALLIPGSIVAGFLVAGPLMVLLNLAQDVRLIQIRLKKTEEK